MDKEKVKFVLFATVNIILVGIVGGYVFATVVDAIDDENVDQCRDEIRSRDNVSEDYRDGWNDCLDYLEWVRQHATNLTMIQG